MKLAPFLIFAFVLFSGAVLSAGAAEAAITLKSQSEIKGAAVRLSDVFNGLPAGSDCDIAQAPAPGKSVIYDNRVLDYLAKEYKLNWRPESLDDHVVINSGSVKIATDDIRAAIAKKLKDQGIKGDIDVEFDNHALDVNLPASYSPDFTLNNFDYDSSGRHFHADFVAEGDRGLFTLPLAGRIVIRHKVPVLAHQLEAGTTVGEADIDWVPIEEDRLNGLVTDAHQLVGRELRHDVEAGEPLHANDVMPPRLVTRGSLVTMRIETPFMLVTAQGKSLQDGVQGDVVRVINTQSDRMVEGVVDGPSSVRIPMPNGGDKAEAGSQVSGGGQG